MTTEDLAPEKPFVRGIARRFVRPILRGEHRPITPRELDVLRLLAKGLRYKEIATALGRTPKTAETHVRRLYDKLGAHTKFEAVLRGRELGLIGDDGKDTDLRDAVNGLIPRVTMIEGKLRAWGRSLGPKARAVRAESI
jgi:DNA-binding CsgD family transcriptional regulator